MTARRGATYVLCRRSARDPAAYPRYPRLPVRACPGYEGQGQNGAGRSAHSTLLDEPPLRAIVRLALPTTAVMLVAALSNALQTFYVSRLGSEPIAAIALVFPVNLILITLMAGGIGAGIASAVARSLGAGRPGRAALVAEHGFVLALGAGLALLLATELAAPPAFRAMGGRGTVLAQATLFGRILFLGLPLMFAGAALDAVMRGEGNVRTPALAGTLSMAVQAVAAPLLMFAAGLGLAGAPLAVLLGQTLALAVRVRRVFGAGGAVRPRPWPRALERRNFAAVLQVGVPTSLAGLATYAGLLLLTAVFARSGTACLAAFGLGTRLDFIFVALGYGAAVASLTLVGMATGAGRGDLARGYVRLTVRLACAVLALPVAVVVLRPDLWLGLFTRDVEILAVGGAYLRLVAPSYLFVTVSMVLGSAFQGMGRATVPLAVVASRTALVVAAAAVCVRVLSWEVEAGFAAIALGNAGGAAALGLLFRSATRRRAAG